MAKKDKKDKRISQYEVEGMDVYEKLYNDIFGDYYADWGNQFDFDEFFDGDNAEIYEHQD